MSNSSAKSGDFKLCPFSKATIGLGVVGLIYLGWQKYVKQASSLPSDSKPSSLVEEQGDQFIEKQPEFLDLSAKEYQDFNEMMKDYCDAFNNSKILQHIIPRSFQHNSQLRKFSENLEFTKNNNDLLSLTHAISEPIWDLLDRGGQRWRPVLCMLLAEGLGSNLSYVGEIAALCEIVHNGTLIVDDIEDSSPVRRNKPCVHLIYGEDISINAGNFMYYAPLARLMQSNQYSDQMQLRFANIYVEEMTQLHLGQGWDIAWHNSQKYEGYVPTESEYLQMTSHKTGVLARLSARLVCAALEKDTTFQKKVSQFAERIGVSFQIQDDILNLEGDEYKKTKGCSGEDIHEGKMTLMVIHSTMNSSKEKAQRLKSILQLKTQDQSVIREAIQIIRDSGSIVYARNLAEQLMMDSWNEFASVFPESLAKQKIKLLAEFVVGRKI